MLELIGKFGFVNDVLKPIDWIKQHFNFKGRPVYEVISLINAIPLFLDDHLERLAQSCRIVGLDMELEISHIEQRILILAEKCTRSNGNLKIIFGELESIGKSLLIVFIPHYLPSTAQYKNGVPVTLLPMERPNPNAKLIKEKPGELNSLIDYVSGYYEVLMVNSRGYITEGSRSNVFFIKDSVFYTSPSKAVLPGITRKKVLELIEDQGLEVRFQLIHKNRLSNFESLFLTGTSPGVLPVKSVNDYLYNVHHPALHKVMSEYGRMVHASCGGGAASG